MKTYAFLDFDKTIIKKDSLSLYIMYLYKKGHISLKWVLNALFWGLCYALKLSTAQKSKAKTLSFLKHHNIDVDVNRAFVQSLPYFMDALNELVKLKKEGFNIIIVSASCDIYMKWVKLFLGVDDVIATPFEQGELGTNCKGEEKVRRITAFLKHAVAQDENNALDTEKSIAYGDSAGDWYMMNMVNHRVIVNNDKLFQKHKDEAVLVKWN